MRSQTLVRHLLVASAASKLAPPGEATYAATKHAVLGYCTAVRAELRGSGVHVNVLMPTVVGTDLAAGTSSGLVPLLTAALVLDLLPARLRGPARRLLVPDQTRSADRAARAKYERGASLEP